MLTATRHVTATNGKGSSSMIYLSHSQVPLTTITIPETSSRGESSDLQKTPPEPMVTAMTQNTTRAETLLNHNSDSTLLVISRPYLWRLEDVAATLLANTGDGEIMDTDDPSTSTSDGRRPHSKDDYDYHHCHPPTNTCGVQVERTSGK